MTIVNADVICTTYVQFTAYTQFASAMLLGKESGKFVSFIH